MEEMLSHSRTKRFDIPLGHIDFDYIKKCTDIKEVERILRILRTGEEGNYPELQKLTEDRLEELDPKNILLRKTVPVPSFKDIDKDERTALTSELKDWMSDMKTMEDSLKTNMNLTQDDDSSLPPIRGEGVTITGDGEVKYDKTKKKVAPRDFREWDKIDVDQELERLDKEEKTTMATKPSGRSIKDLSPKVDTSGLSGEEKFRKANMEKDKGNEAFNCGDYDESIMYYSRSISIHPLPKSFNNRALAYLKLSKWDYALTDLERVIEEEPNNIKALLRMGMAYKGKKRFEEAKKCFEKVLQLEPNNKRAEAALEESEKEEKKYKSEKEKRKVKGRRMKIEDVSDSEETKEVEQKVINGWQKTETGEETNQTVKGNRGSVKENAVTGQDRPTICPTGMSAENRDTKDIWQSDEVNEETESENSTNTTCVASTSESSPHSSLDGNTSLASGDCETRTDTPTDSQEAAAGASSPFHTRTVLYQYPMSSGCAKLREEGNTLFRSGRYAEASEKYQQAITKFGKVTEETTVSLSLVHSNLAACLHKMGNCSSAVDNSKKALDLVPHSIKPLLRRATAYEALELYPKAYVDFKHILSIDSSIQQAHQGSSRCQHVLSDRHGSTWREKLPPLVKVNPWEIPLILEVGPDGKKPSVPVQVQSAEKPLLSPSQPSTADTIAQNTHCADSHTIGVDPAAEGSCLEGDAADSCVECPDPDGCFQQLKLQGNENVQKNNFKEAVECYTKCIDIFPDRAVGYTNRALCYLRLNQALEAHADCCKALELEAENTKALYRKAQAKKMMHQYKESLQDLFTLLKLEPNNVAAKKEVEIVKKYYKEELEKVNCQSAKTTPSKKEDKPRKRMNIVEVDGDEEDGTKEHKKSETKTHLPSKKSVPNAAGKQPGAESAENKSAATGNKTAASPATDAGTQPNRKSKKKAKSAKTTGTNSPTPAPSVPNLEKASPYEFIQAWNALKTSQGIQPYADLLRNVAPDELPRVISKHFDGPMLQKITACVKNDFIKNKDFDRGYKTLFHLCKVSRFGTVSMFMSKVDKNEMREIMTSLATHKSEMYSASDIDYLREKYSVKV
ncbi:sperm-associated antigen 1-like [Gigantopelta aegis]|uniref:sperm-associated antigen 1-like n=1 Tax=Gigantopelta aegis TaxID=1735272 RepID=UPI001B889590|nr:sperm-associated antigen 1-like [Gigantopelta aegis]